MSGSAPLPVPVFEKLRELTGQAPIERYGMSETGMNTANPLDGERKPGTVGPPLPGVECLVVNDAGDVLPAGEPVTSGFAARTFFKAIGKMRRKRLNLLRPMAILKRVISRSLMMKATSALLAAVKISLLLVGSTSIQKKLNWYWTQSMA